MVRAVYGEGLYCNVFQIAYFITEKNTLNKKKLFVEKFASQIGSLNIDSWAQIRCDPNFENAEEHPHSSSSLKQQQKPKESHFVV